MQFSVATNNREDEFCIYFLKPIVGMCVKIGNLDAKSHCLRYHRGVRSAKGGGLAKIFWFLAFALPISRRMYQWGDSDTLKKPRKSRHLAKIIPNVETCSPMDETKPSQLPKHDCKSVRA